jgi:uncharacterized protein YggE
LTFLKGESFALTMMQGINSSQGIDFGRRAVVAGEPTLRQPALMLAVDDAAPQAKLH